MKLFSNVELKRLARLRLGEPSDIVAQLSKLMASFTLERLIFSTVSLLRTHWNNGFPFSRLP